MRGDSIVKGLGPIEHFLLHGTIQFNFELIHLLRHLLRLKKTVLQRALYSSLIGHVRSCQSKNTKYSSTE